MTGPRSIQELSPVLVANRGEIAVRVQRTLRALGLRDIAIHSDVDLEAPHVAGADLAVRVDSYLDPGAVIDAARRSEARSIHPGYGFLSESAGFARAVADAGLTWIGPPPAAIELMGDKGRSKELAREAGVPILPGTEGTDASADQIGTFAAEHGFPVMIKALAGGGGKGMRIVGDRAQLDDALAAARREAEAAFGDGRVLAERYLERARHIEIQVLADSHGNVTHLGERECSLQRRHQKLIEEAPSPAIDGRRGERMAEAAVSLARACRYEGAGTVEFIVPTGSDEFFFLEMNTRLQVEHPVTELTWNVDLVAEQLRVAAGEELSPGLRDRTPSGHAIEARLYAEDPAAGFLPASGTIRRWREPALKGVRVDAGVAEGTVVGTDYDPMLAKLIAHGPDRETAIGRLRRALDDLELLGVANSAAFSSALLDREDVRRGELDTGLVERALADLDLGPPEDLLAAAAVALLRADTAGLGIAAGPWRRRFAGLGEVRIGEGELSCERGSWAFESRELSDGRLLVSLGGLTRTYAISIDAGRAAVWVGRDGHQLEARLERRDIRDAAPLSGSLEAPMPGKVLLIEVANGDRVEEGDALIVLESMKMELQITAPRAGTVEGLTLAVGDRVGQGDALLAVTAATEAGEEER